MGIESIPIKPSWYPPEIPVLSKEDKIKYQNEPQNLGFCWGANLYASRYPVRTENGPSDLYIFTWKGHKAITVETDYYTGQMRGVWLDVNGDGRAEEYFLNIIQIKNTYKERTWVCPLIKHVLDYWR